MANLEPADVATGFLNYVTTTRTVITPTRRCSTPLSIGRKQVGMTTLEVRKAFVKRFPDSEQDLLQSGERVPQDL